MTERPTLMVPGPVDYHPAVLAEMSRPMVPHYGAAWVKVFIQVQGLLREVLQTDSEPFLYVGSGHLGLDAAFNSLCERGDPVIVLENGHFGERLSQVARSHGAEVLPVRAPWATPISAPAIEAALEAAPRARCVAVVHLETSTGMLNPLADVAALAKRHGKLLVVDAVSSAGLTPLTAQQLGIDVLITASQKGLGAPPGLVVVAVSEVAWDAIAGRQTSVPGWYNNLARWREVATRQRDVQPYFITMAVNNVWALKQSLEMILAEGLTARFERHTEVAAHFRQGLASLGLQVVAPPGYESPGVTAIRCPEGAKAVALRDRLLARTGIMVGTGLGPWRDSTLRVGHMGYNARIDLIEQLLEGLGAILRSAA